MERFSGVIKSRQIFLNLSLAQLLAKSPSHIDLYVVFFYYYFLNCLGPKSSDWFSNAAYFRRLPRHRFRIRFDCSKSRKRFV